MLPVRRVGSNGLQRVLLLSEVDGSSFARALEDAGLAVVPVTPDRLGSDAAMGDGEAPPPVLVVLDDPTDLAPLYHVRAALPHHPVVAVSHRGDPPSDDDVRAAGCDGSLCIDQIDPGEVLACIRAAAERRGLLLRIQELEARLESSEARFRNTVQRSADGILIADVDARVLFANEAAERLFDRKADELLGEQLIFQAPDEGTTEIGILRKDGKRGIAELRVARTEWEGQEALLVSLRDVTSQREAEERKRGFIREQSARREAEAAARRGKILAEGSRALYASLESEEVLRALAEVTVAHSGDVCIAETLVADIHLPESRTVRVREGFEADPVVEALRDEKAPVLAGAAAEAVIEDGKPVSLGPGRKGWPEGLLRSPRLARVLEDWGLETILLTPLNVGSRMVGVLAILHFEGGRPIDDGDRVLIEELGRRAGLALENARLYRLASQGSRAKSDFLNVVSHELRTPLTGIVGYTGLIRDGLAGPVDEEELTYLRGIERNSRHLLRIIDQILLFADTEEERQEVRYTEEAVDTLVADVLSLVRPMAERKGLELRTALPDGRSRIRMDAGKVRLIMLHLLANAVKFTPAGWIELGMDVVEDHLMVTVTDSGIGIPEEKRDEVFEPFNQLEASQTRVSGGMGIGLNVVKNLTHLLGGRIGLESAPGRGTTFRVKLPLEAPSETERKAAD